MQIANLSPRARRRTPAFRALGSNERRLRVIVEAEAEPVRQRLTDAIALLPVSESLDIEAGDSGGSSGPCVRIASVGALDSELELRAETGGSGTVAALVFELVQSLAQKSFGVHITFSEPATPQKLNFPSNRR